ncbi:hypothetical protein O3P69_001895 [Scylla paramamosain]|uniref:Uncharacterized protein n=1 Tax=Scylla paramamosain TaxID=85552 RepID=A0AAW0V0D5_SCYPA
MQSTQQRRSPARHVKEDVGRQVYFNASVISCLLTAERSHCNYCVASGGPGRAPLTARYSQQCGFVFIRCACVTSRSPPSPWHPLLLLLLLLPTQPLLQPTHHRTMTRGGLRRGRREGPEKRRGRRRRGKVSPAEAVKTRRGKSKPPLFKFYKVSRLHPWTGHAAFASPGRET